MALSYDEDIVKRTYHFAKPRDLSPSLTKLRKWDKNLKSVYEDDLVEKMVEFGIRRTKGNKSVIVMLAEASKKNSSALRVKDACKYFNHVKDMNL